MSDGRDFLRDMWTRTSTNDGMVNSPEEVKRRGEIFNTNDMHDLYYMPDQRMHRIVSFVKSGFRIIGAVMGMVGYVPAAFGLFFLAEVVGIYEELV